VTFNSLFIHRDDPACYLLPIEMLTDILIACLSKVVPGRGVGPRHRRGHAGRLSNPAVAAPPPTADSIHAEPAQSIDELVDTYATPAHIEPIATAAQSDGGSVAVDTITDRLCGVVGRRHPEAFLGADGLDQPTFRSAVAEQVHRHRHG